MNPLLVGELNPYGDDDHFALYPRPERASGHRLATLVMGLTEAEYLRRFDRVNLCYRKWSLPAARENAAGIYAGPHDHIVLFGAKVAKAFDLPFKPFFITRVTSGCVHGHNAFAHPCPPPRIRAVVQLPHPSGLCRAWNEPGAFARARETLKQAGIL